ncbi:hypothetical protein V9K67_09960 [Paraflavisolibacter sp. H34]|uniref:hypothetical protein n=1 Tax=Huijunlia imazamoxiresistens TaxID=3127457 RepID=UPI00301AF20B
MSAHRNNISGIHNYCDRWCERCCFTARCAVYESIQDQSPEEQDITNRAFWEHLSQNFKNATQMITQAAKEHGIDICSMSQEEMDALMEKEKETRRHVRQHPISQLSFQYLEEGKRFLEHQHLQEEAEEAIHQVELGIKSEEEALDLILKENDCLEVIQWYLHFIYIKFSRALSGKIEDEGWEEAHGFQKDSDGSAKIALIAIERSMQAWAQLLTLSPCKEDGILPLLACLDKVRKLALNEFPHAPCFVRPGFDDPS